MSDVPRIARVSRLHAARPARHPADDHRHSERKWCPREFRRMRNSAGVTPALPEACRAAPRASAGSSGKQGRNLWKRAKTPETQIQMPHEQLAASRLISLVELLAGLDVRIGGEQEDKLTPCPESCRGCAAGWPPTRSPGWDHAGIPPCDGPARQSARGIQEPPWGERPNHPIAR